MHSRGVYHDRRSLINPLAVHWDSIFLAVTRGEVSFLLAYTIAAFLQLAVPALLMFLGWRLLVRATPMRLRWQVLIVLYSVAELLVARALLDITTWFSLVHRYPAIGFYLAYGAILGFLVSGLLMPHAIPERSDWQARRASRPGRPRAFDYAIYARRNVVERGINRLK